MEIALSNFTFSVRYNYKQASPAQFKSLLLTFEDWKIQSIGYIQPARIAEERDEC